MDTRLRAIWNDAIQKLWSQAHDELFISHIRCVLRQVPFVTYSSCARTSQGYGRFPNNFFSFCMKVFTWHTRGLTCTNRITIINALCKKHVQEHNIPLKGSTTKTRDTQHKESSARWLEHTAVVIHRMNVDNAKKTPHGILRWLRTLFVRSVNRRVYADVSQSRCNRQIRNPAAGVATRLGRGMKTHRRGVLITQEVHYMHHRADISLFSSITLNAWTRSLLCHKLTKTFQEVSEILHSRFLSLNSQRLLLTNLWSM